MIGVEKRDQCLEYLAATDEPFAKAKAYMLGVEDQKSTILAGQFLRSTLNTVDAKKAESQTSKEYWDWREKHKDSVYDYEIMRNKRSTAALFIELWRSEFSARKQGMII